MHSDCTGCPYHAICLDKACIKETRHEVDAVVSVDVTAHNLIEVRECPMHGGVKTSAFPANIKAAVQYGKTFRRWLLLSIQLEQSASTVRMKYCPACSTSHWQQEPSKTW